MTLPIKDAADLTPADFEAFPVWEFLYNDELGESMVKPVLDLPIDKLDHHLIGTPMRLANGTIMPSMVGNVDVNDSAGTREYMTVSIYHNNRRIRLARFRDPDIHRNGPAALAKCLGLDIDDVFPIAYDLRAWCTGDPGVLVGTIDKAPKQG